MFDRYQPVFRDANVSVLRLKGLSSPTQRRNALYLHWGLGLGLLWVFMNSNLVAAAQEDGFTVMDAALKALAIIVVTDVARRLWCPHIRAPHQWIRRFSLIGIIEDRDRQVYQACFNEIERLNTRAYLPNALRDLVDFEPELRRFAFLRLAALQRRGELMSSLITTQRIRTTGRFFYLMHLAEKRRQDADAGRDTEIF